MLSAFLFATAFGRQAKSTRYALPSGTRVAAGSTATTTAATLATGAAAAESALPSVSARPARVSSPRRQRAPTPSLPLVRTTTGTTTLPDRAKDSSSSSPPAPKPAPPSTPPPPPPAPPPAQNTTPITIGDVHTVALTPFSATIAWNTSEPVSSRVAYGLDAPTLWTPADAATTSHVATVDGLVDGTSYRFRVDVKASDGRTASSSPLVVTTPSLRVHRTLTVGNGAFELNGRPTFPTMVWAACADQIPSLLAAGIDMFLGKNCGDGSSEVAALGNHGYYVGDAFQPGTAGAVGSFLPDEWDTSLPNDVTAADIRQTIPATGSLGPRVLTLTNHFFSQAAPLPQGRGMYPALVANADAVGFDLYPLESWCRYDDFGTVFDSQRELTQLAAGKPTYQWIETAQMDCPGPSLEPTPQTVHAETWLAVAGGAHAIGYFPKDFSPAIGAEIAADKSALGALAPALVEPPIDATGSGNIRVGAREHNGAIYVIAVNASRESSTPAISVPALGDRSLVSLDGSRSLTASSGVVTDTFGPLEVRIYVAAP